MTADEQQIAALKRWCCIRINEDRQRVSQPMQQMQHFRLARARAFHIYQSILLRARVKGTESADLLLREGFSLPDSPGADVGAW